jgi:hypothetical protein
VISREQKSDAQGKKDGGAGEVCSPDRTKEIVHGADFGTKIRLVWRIVSSSRGLMAGRRMDVSMKSMSQQNFKILGDEATTDNLKSIAEPGLLHRANNRVRG